MAGKELFLNLEFEVRSDGVYLTFRRDSGDPPPLSNIQKALDERGVMNYDLAKIGGVLERRRGAPERVGDVFKVFDPEKEKHIVVHATPLDARVMLASGLRAAGLAVTVEDIFFRLRMSGVVHGIDRKSVEDLVLGVRYDKETVVARATPPVRGEDARRVEMVNMEVSLRPKVTTAGKADYRETENLHQVMVGDVLAEKFPPTPGKEGLSVFGIPLPADPGIDLPLTGGENTAVSSDGMKLLAKKAGFAYRGANGITVGELYLVRGNLDFSAGNINYVGDVLIHGNVLPGFEVKASGDVAVRGEVEAANLVSKEKSVFVGGGVIGKGRCEITAARDVEVLHVQNASLNAEQKVHVKKHALNTLITAGVLADVEEALGGTIASYGSIVVRRCGNVSGTKTTLLLMDRDLEKNKKKYRRLQELLTELDQKIRFQETTLKDTNRRLAALGVERANPKLLSQLKSLLSEFQANRKKREFLNQQKAGLEELVNQRRSFEGRIMVMDECFPGTVVRILDQVHNVMARLVKVSFALVEGEIRLDAAREQAQGNEAKQKGGE